MFIFACDNNLPKPIKKKSPPIAFTQTHTFTKASESSFKIKAGGVLAYHLLPDEFNEAIWNNNTTPNFMYNQKMVAQENGQLTYSPVKYWPSNPNDKIKFFAYSPHSSETKGSITLSSATNKEYPTIFYTLSSEQVDLLVAVITPLNPSPVSLNFKHALTQVSFSAKCSNNSSSQKVTITS